MYNNTNENIKNSLIQISNFRPPPIDNIEPDFIKKEKLFPPGLIGFVADLNEDNNIDFIFSTLNEENNFYQSAIDNLTNENFINHKIKLDNVNWAIMKTTRKDFTQIVFLDVTLQLSMLNKLMYTFIFVSILVVLLTFFISNYLTNIYIKPIKDSFEKQNQFISDASHELKTPLTVINSNVDVLLNNHRGSTSEKWLLYIQTEVSRMVKLTENLLFLSKFENIDVSVNYSNVNISDVAEHLLIGIETLIFEKNLKLNYKIDKDLFVKGNPEQLSQVIMILLDNAMKYTTDKGLIDFSIKKISSQIQIVITNENEGISDEDINHIFDRFFKTDTSRQNTNNGYGLGLSIAQKIINKHNGKLSCKSELGKSTTFIIKLSSI
jgi:signal transduction histidine kinase